MNIVQVRNLRLVNSLFMRDSWALCIETNISTSNTLLYLCTHIWDPNESDTSHCRKIFAYVLLGFYNECPNLKSFYVT